jgi:hypothetical protein
MMEGDCKMDWVSILVDFVVYIVPMAICAIIMLALIDSTVKYYFY